MLKTVKYIQDTVTTEPQKDKLLLQLKRISGQIQGVVSMYEEERSCVDIARQLSAVRNSLGRVARDMLTCEAVKCSRERRVGDLDELLKELFR